MGSMARTYGSLNVNNFEKIGRIGEGTYGTVYKARARDTGAIVALKRVLQVHDKEDGFPLTSLRELSTLRRCRHSRVVGLEGVAVSSQDTFLVLEYCEHDLTHLLQMRNNHGGGGAGNGSCLSTADAKRLCVQLLEAVSHLHSRFVMHRDIKLSNLLYSHRGGLKLADFGLARTFGFSNSYSHAASATTTATTSIDSRVTHLHTPGVTTLWYRAPEVLLGASNYDESVDLWACGLVLTEILGCAPLLPAADDNDLVWRIFSLLGTPNEKIWPALKDLPSVVSGAVDVNSEKAKTFRYNNLPERLLQRGLEDSAIRLIERLVVYAPQHRLRARAALDHEYFSPICLPLPTHPAMLPAVPSAHPVVALSGTISRDKRSRSVGDTGTGKGISVGDLQQQQRSRLHYNQSDAIA